MLLAAVLPVLGARDFYLAGDSVAAWLPAGRRIGDLLSAGESHLMDPTAWRGGNYVAEAGFGLWNPVVLLLDMTVLQLDDLAVAATVVKAIYMLILSVGVYLLAREYGATAWPSALAGLVVPVAGFTLWMDAATWTPNLVSFAFFPFVWLTARRLGRGAGGPIWLVLAGALCVSAGNPYSNVIVGVVVIGVAIEQWLQRSERALARVVALGLSLAAIALLAVFVYLPFRETSSVGFRETVVSNDETFAPGLENLVGLSSPTMTPLVDSFGTPLLKFPATYLAWFILPLAPWLRWRKIIDGWQRFAGLGVFCGTFVLLSLGPSNFWFFRWPIRLVPYAYLPLVIVTAVALSAGVATDHRRRRVIGSVAAIVVPTYLAWSDVPDEARWHLFGAVLVAVLVAGVVAMADRSSVLGPFMLVATLLVLAMQLQFRPTNQSVRDYYPPSASELVDGVGRYDGTVLLIANLDKVPGPERVPAVYRDLSFGSISLLAGIENVSAYSGIGFTAHDDAVCLRFDGATCSDAWARLWLPVDGSERVLADLLRLDTVVVQRTVIETTVEPIPPGWSIDEVNDAVVVWTRSEPLAWPEGRLAQASGPVEIGGDVAERAHVERVDFARTGAGPAELTFARLTWPGYEAFVDGSPVPIRPGPAGLVTVSIPEEVTSGTVTLTWSPPLWRPSILAALLGLLLGIGTQVWWRRAGESPRGESNS
ncbi:MAG: hypothetical protein ACERLM_03775 [Acidimicrobiales bacterium]